MRVSGVLLFPLVLTATLLSNSPIIGSPSAHAAMSWSCAELNTRWPLYHRELKVRWPLGSFSCPSSMATIVEAVALLHDLPTVPDAQGRSNSYYDWLVRTEKGIDYSNEEIAGAMAHYHGTSVITIMNPFFKAPLTQRAAMLVHEGRHATFPADPGHVTCASGLDAGKAGHCDAEFHPFDGAGSGYSWGFTFMWHVMENPNIVPSEHDQILSLLKWEINNRYNLVREQDKTFFMARWNWDGK